MAENRSVLKPMRPEPVPHPPMAQLYTDTDAPVPYLDLPALVTGEVQTGVVIDDADVDGYRRSAMVVQVECDAAPDNAILYLHVLPSLDGVNFSDATVNTAEADVYLPPGVGRVVLWNVPAPPTPFRMALSTSADLGAVGVSYAFYGTVDVPQ